MPVQPDKLLPNELLGADQSISSMNGIYTFVYQGDGNLVLYKNYRSGARRPLWASGTNGRPVGECIMQGDGNLVIYGPAGTYVWDTATNSQLGSSVVVQDDGNVVIYAPDRTPIWATNTVQNAVPNGPEAQGDSMRSGEVLNPNQSIASANGRYSFVYQNDGNLVLYKNYRDRDWRALWASNTAGRPAGVCIMQGDGNLVLYGPDAEYIWDAATDGLPGCRFVVQDDGNGVIYRPEGAPAWATNTVQPTIPSGPTALGDDMQPGEALAPGQSITSSNGSYTLTYQVDGNLVLYRTADGKPLWASNTQGKPAEVCILQGDGNLVIYGPDGEYIWDTATNGNSGSHLVVQDNGEVVIDDAHQGRLWSSETAAPVISSFTPTSAQQGDAVTVHGDHFVRVLDVRVNGASAKYKLNARTTITAIVPDNATSGPIEVVTPVGSVRSNEALTVVPTPPPEITKVDPNSTEIGGVVNLYGRNFRGVTRVSFSGATAKMVNFTPTWLTVIVPDQAISGPITLESKAGNVATHTAFVVLPVTPPGISDFFPTSAEPGATVTIRGNHFKYVNAVRITGVQFSGVSAQFDVNSENLVMCVVPPAAESGPITLTGIVGSAKSAVSFTVVSASGIGSLVFTNGTDPTDTVTVWTIDLGTQARAGVTLAPGETSNKGTLETGHQYEYLATSHTKVSDYNARFGTNLDPTAYSTATVVNFQRASGSLLGKTDGPFVTITVS